MDFVSFHRYAVVQVRNTYWADQQTAMIAEGMYTVLATVITRDYNREVLWLKIFLKKIAIAQSADLH